MPLNLADINTDYTIQKICGNEDDRHHLETLGFIEEDGNAPSYLFFSVPYIVRHQRKQIGIDQAFAKMIIVQA